MHRSRSAGAASAVTATMGILGNRPHRIDLVASKPSINGIWQSIRTRSYPPVSTAAAASTPFSTACAQYPSLSSCASVTSRLMALSSATRIRGWLVAGTVLPETSTAGLDVATSFRHFPDGHEKATENQKVEPHP